MQLLLVKTDLESSTIQFLLVLNWKLLIWNKRSPFKFGQFKKEIQTINISLWLYNVSDRSLR